MKFDKVERDDSDGKHRYRSGRHRPYHSVTEMIGWGQDRTNLIKWQQDMGEKLANYIKNTTAKAGDAAHLYNEFFLRKEPLRVPRKGGSLLGWAHHLQFIPYLKRITSVKAVELMMVSHTFKLGGTADVIASYDGIQAIIDWKTKRKPPRKEYMHDYFVQETVYSMMYEQMTGTRIDKLVVVYSSETRESGDFIDFRSNYEAEARDRIAKYTAWCAEQEKTKGEKLKVFG